MKNRHQKRFIGGFRIQGVLRDDQCPSVRATEPEVPLDGVTPESCPGGPGPSRGLPFASGWTAKVCGPSPLPASPWQVEHFAEADLKISRPRASDSGLDGVRLPLGVTSASA